MEANQEAVEGLLELQTSFVAPMAQKVVIVTRERVRKTGAKVIPRLGISPPNVIQKLFKMPVTSPPKVIQKLSKAPPLPPRTASYVTVRPEPCKHKLRPNYCKICSLCPHGENKFLCTTCTGLCRHGNPSRQCHACWGASICPHGVVKYSCRECK